MLKFVSYCASPSTIILLVDVPCGRTHWSPMFECINTALKVVRHLWTRFDVMCSSLRDIIAALLSRYSYRIWYLSRFTVLIMADILACIMLHLSGSLKLTLSMSILRNNLYISWVGDSKHTSKLIKIITSIWLRTYNQSRIRQYRSISNHKTTNILNEPIETDRAGFIFAS